MPTLPELLQEPAVQQLRQLLMGASERVREGIFRQYFSPALTTPRPNPEWLETDQEQYRDQLRDKACAIRE